MDDANAVSIYVRKWLADERNYTIKKFGLELDDINTRWWNNLQTHRQFESSWWESQFTNYLGRAQILTLDTPNGRQALAKFVATGIGMLEAAVRIYGELPEPGVPSGENLDKLREI